jgi:hypothetical protein
VNVGVKVMVGVFVGVPVAVEVRVWVAVKLFVGVKVIVGLFVTVEVAVLVKVPVIVGLFVGVGVSVTVAVWVGVEVMIEVKVFVGAGGLTGEVLVELFPQEEIRLITAARVTTLIITRGFFKFRSLDNFLYPFTQITSSRQGHTSGCGYKRVEKPLRIGRG